MILDTHLHLVDRGRLSYPWLTSAPALDRDATLAAYRRTAAQVGIIGALHMEVDVAEADIDRETDWIESLAADGFLLGCISACRPESAEFPAHLDRIRQRPIVKGLRRILHQISDELSESDRFRANLRRLSGTGLTFDICMRADQLPRAAALIDACPDVTFILDHCGVPDIVAGDRAAWATGIAEVARRPNVVGKMSGIIAYAGPDWQLDDLRPYVDHMLARFGWGRLVWGSDSPVCTLGGSLETWVAASHALLSGLAPGERAAILAGNARRLWSLAR